MNRTKCLFCKFCKFSIDINGILVCEKCNIPCRIVKNCALDKYPFCNRYDYNK